MLSHGLHCAAYLRAATAKCHTHPPITHADVSNTATGVSSTSARTLLCSLRSRSERCATCDAVADQGPAGRGSGVKVRTGVDARIAWWGDGKGSHTVGPTASVLKTSSQQCPGAREVSARRCLVLRMPGCTQELSVRASLSPPGVDAFTPPDTRSVYPQCESRDSPPT